MLATGSIFWNNGVKDVPIIYEQTRDLTGRDPDYELLSGAELRLTIPLCSPAGNGY